MHKHLSPLITLMNKILLTVFVAITFANNTFAMSLEDICSYMHHGAINGNPSSLQEGLVRLNTHISRYDMSSALDERSGALITPKMRSFFTELQQHLKPHSATRWEETHPFLAKIEPAKAPIELWECCKLVDCFRLLYPWNLHKIFFDSTPDRERRYNTNLLVYVQQWLDTKDFYYEEEDESGAPEIVEVLRQCIGIGHRDQVEHPVLLATYQAVASKISIINELAAVTQAKRGFLEGHPDAKYLNDYDAIFYGRRLKDLQDLQSALVGWLKYKKLM